MMIDLHSHRSIRLLLAFGLCILLGAAQAQKKPSTSAAVAPKEEPATMILSDTLHFDDTKRESTFTGNVVMTRGLMTMNADSLHLREDPEGFQYGTGTVKPGKRVLIRQARPTTSRTLTTLWLGAWRRWMILSSSQRASWWSTTMPNCAR